MQLLRWCLTIPVIKIGISSYGLSARPGTHTTHCVLLPFAWLYNAQVTNLNYVKVIIILSEYCVTISNRSVRFSKHVRTGEAFQRNADCTFTNSGKWGPDRRPRDLPSLLGARDGLWVPEAGSERQLFPLCALHLVSHSLTYRRTRPQLLSPKEEGLDDSETYDLFLHKILKKSEPFSESVQEFQLNLPENLI